MEVAQLYSCVSLHLGNSLAPVPVQILTLKGERNPNIALCIKAFYIVSLMLLDCEGVILQRQLIEPGPVMFVTVYLVCLSCALATGGNHAGRLLDSFVWSVQSELFLSFPRCS